MKYVISSGKLKKTVHMFANIKMYLYFLYIFLVYTIVVVGSKKLINKYKTIKMRI